MRRLDPRTHWQDLRGCNRVGKRSSDPAAVTCAQCRKRLLRALIANQLLPGVMPPVRGATITRQGTKTAPTNAVLVGTVDASTTNRGRTTNPVVIPIALDRPLTQPNPAPEPVPSTPEAADGTPS